MAEGILLQPTGGDSKDSAQRYGVLCFVIKPLQYARCVWRYPNQSEVAECGHHLQHNPLEEIARILRRGEVLLLC
jgi:hypothetical protein